MGNIYISTREQQRKNILEGKQHNHIEKTLFITQLIHNFNYTTYLKMQKCGGFTDFRPATEDIQKLCDEVSCLNNTS